MAVKNNKNKFNQFLSENFSYSRLTEDDKKRLEKSSMYKIWVLGKYLDEFEEKFMKILERLIERWKG